MTKYQLDLVSGHLFSPEVDSALLQAGVVVTNLDSGDYRHYTFETDTTLTDDQTRGVINYITDISNAQIKISKVI